MLFKEIKLIEPIQKALEKSGYVTATPIQAKSIPHILQGKDLIGIAQTGTGKTAAFTLPILQNMFNQSLKVTFTTPKTLILAPTRELAAQIGESIENYGKFTHFKHTVIFGGVKQDAQVRALNKGIEIIIATPGRLLDLLNQGLVNLSQIEYLILDEADRMLDMGFINDIKKILKNLPKQRQTLFFSATMPDSIVKLTKDFMNNPLKVEVTPQSKTIDKIKQEMYFIDTKDKNDLLLDLLSPEEIKTTIVFTRTKHKANKIAKYLSENNIKAEAIHGNKSQNARTRTLANFKSGQIKAVIATEIFARGIDIDNVSHVINYELPNEPESYVHRIGRTARAGTEGIAYSFCCADEREYLRDIEVIIKQKIPVMEHKYHSTSAQNARGSDAKPPKKERFHQKNNGFAKSNQNNQNNGKKSNSHVSKNRNDSGNRGQDRNNNKNNNNDRKGNDGDNKKEGNHRTRNHTKKPFKKKNTNYKPRR